MELLTGDWFEQLLEHLQNMREIFRRCWKHLKEYHFMLNLEKCDLV
jgi:hypothetical protein